MDKDYLVNEHPAKALIVLSLPIIIGNLFQQLYTTVDQIVVGRYVSEDALAAVGASYSLTNVFIAIAIGGGVGASVIASRNFGAHKYRELKESVCTSLISFAVLSLVMGVVGFCAGSGIMRLLHAPERVMADATTYLRIYFCGLPFLFMYNILSAMFNALGRSRIPLYLLIFSSLLNMALDVYMVRSLELGVAGVAYATFAAQGVSAVLSFLIFLHGMKQYPSEPLQTYFRMSSFTEAAGIAFPSIIQQSTISIGMMLVQSVINRFGAEALAGFSAGMRIDGIAVVPMLAMGTAMSAYTAQNLGAGRQDRVVRGLRIASFGICGFFAVVDFIVLQLWSPQLMGLFLGEDGSDIALSTGTSLLRFLSVFFIMNGLKMSTDGVLRGSGDMKMFMVANLANIALRYCVAAVFAPRYGIHCVWMAVPVGWTVNFLISYAEYRTGKWRLKSA